MKNRLPDLGYREAFYLGLTLAILNASAVSPASVGFWVAMLMSAMPYVARLLTYFFNDQ